MISDLNKIKQLSKEREDEIRNLGHLLKENKCIYYDHRPRRSVEIRICKRIISHGD